MPEQDDNLDDWLLSDAARPWLAVASDRALPAHQLATKLRAELSVDQTHRVLELAELRQRGLAKFIAAADMFFQRVSLEQASDQWLAAYKSQRFAGAASVADLCCGIGGDALGLAAVAGQLTLCDLNAGLVKFARRNLQVAVPQSTAEVDGRSQDVAQLDLAGFDAWHIDPDRRAAGKRTTHAEFHEPSDAVIQGMLDKNPHAAIKLAPACEVPPRWAEAGELEWMGRDGECRQLVVWHGKLTEQSGQRRATLLRAEGPQHQVVRTLVGLGDEPIAGTDSIERYLYEPDATVLASGLTGELANQHGWSMFASTGGYLTGETLVDEPAASRFEVEDVVPLNIKKLARYLRVRNVGQLEIKVRAVDVRPEQLRRDLKLKGDHRATLLVTRVGEKRIAIVASRV